MSEFDPLREEHDRLRAEARKARREFARTPASVFVDEMEKAIAGYLEMRGQGVSREDACRGLEHVIHEMWPKRVTRFPALCDACLDTGYRLRYCHHDLRCQRARCRDQHPSFEHPYVEPCECAKGDRFRPRERTDEHEIAAVGKVKKRSGGFSRYGR